MRQQNDFASKMIVASNEFYDAAYRFYADIQTPDDGMTRADFLAEIGNALRVNALDHNVQYGHGDGRVRYLFATAQERALLTDILNDDDFGLRLRKRQEGTVIEPKPLVDVSQESAVMCVEYNPKALSESAEAVPVAPELLALRPQTF